MYEERLQSLSNPPQQQPPQETASKQPGSLQLPANSPHLAEAAETSISAASVPLMTESRKGSDASTNYPRALKSMYEERLQLPSHTLQQPPPLLQAAASTPSGSQQAPILAGQRRVLYQQADKPDNYTDETFLQHLVLNANVRVRQYWEVVAATTAVSQQLATVVVAVAAPYYLTSGIMTAQVLLVIDAMLMLLGFLVCALAGHILGGSLVWGLRQVCLLAIGVWLLAPLYNTLTGTISTDTMLVTTAVLLLVHLYLHDYDFVSSVTDKLTGSLSLAAATFSSVLIASRLANPGQVFAQILYSLELYLLWPYVRRYFQAKYPQTYTASMVAFIGFSIVVVYPISGGLCVAYVLVIAFVTFVCPWCLVGLHKFKRQISGPWDEADPKISFSLRNSK